MLSVDFFLYINMGTAFQLLYLIKIIKMAAELCNGVLKLPAITTVISRVQISVMNILIKIPTFEIG